MNFWRRSSSAEKKNINTGLLLCLAGLFVLICAVLSLCFGSSGMGVGELFAAMTGHGSETAVRIFKYFRLPRTLACLLTGAALSVSGAVIQSVLANRLASPSIIGINAGAGLAVTIAAAAGLIGSWVVAGAAFTGAVIAALAITLTARATGASRTSVILGGVAVTIFLNAITEAVMYLSDDAAALSTDFRTGGFSAITMTKLLPAAIVIIIAFIAVMTLTNEMDILALGDDTASGVGMRVNFMRTLLIALAAVMAGAAVSIAGLLGFVGLVVPHICRLIAGSESRRLIPFSALFGAGFVTLCDLAARLIFAPYELPAGIILSAVGGPFFIWLLIRRKGGHSHA